MSVGIIANSVLFFSMILMLGSLCGFFSEKVGIVNISINGQMVFGALIFTIFAEILYPRLGENSFFLPMIISSILTVLCSSLFGLLTIKMKTNQVIAGTAINLLVGGLGLFLAEPLGPVLSNGLHAKITSNYLSLIEVGNNSGFFATTLILFILVIILVIGLILLMKFTPFGLRLQAIGNNPNAVDAQGINVERYQWISVTIGGLIAGFAGSLYMFSRPGPFMGDVSGFGFLSLAILIAGSWRIHLILVVSISFAFITEICKNVNAIPKDIAKLIPFAITLLGLAFFSKYNVAPKNLGIPFDKTKR